MVSLAHNAHRRLICWKRNSTKSLLEGPLVYNKGALGMGTINKGTSQGNVNRFWRWHPKHSQIGFGKK
jgi:hypothetical protein